MLDKKVLKEALCERLHCHLTLLHPIFEQLFDKLKQNTNLLHKVMRRSCQLTEHFLGFIEPVYFQCSLPRSKKALLHAMYESMCRRRYCSGAAIAREPRVVLA